MSIESFRGDPIAPGFAVGPLRMPPGGSWTPPPTDTHSDPCREIDRFRRQVGTLERKIEEAVEQLESDAFRAEAEIMRTHLEMLRDPELHRQVFELVQDSRHRAETAVEHVLESMAAMLACAEDPVLAERAADLRDLAMRLASGLSGTYGPAPAEGKPSMAGAILALPELMPSMVLDARDRRVAGFVVECGTTVSHAAILAKSFGMPVVRVARLESITRFVDRDVLVWGGGEVLVEPTEAELAERQPSAEAIPSLRTEGTVPVRVWISIVDPDQLKTVDWTGVAGVGLYRSEALFIRHRDDFPNEQQQFAAYRRLFELAGPRPVVFRTLDLGADKPVEHMHFGPQDNPCLGLRAHRLYRFHPEIFLTQIRAVLRAAIGTHQLRLMYPMIESIEQLHFVKGLVEKAQQTLADERLPFQHDFRQGVLIETPSAAWSFGRLIEEVDFASVGTNDLVQYLFAVERNAANVADLYQPEHPVVLQVIDSLALQAATVGKPLSLCGEMAADPSMLPLLVGLGVTDLSVAASTRTAMLRGLATLDQPECTQLAGRCLQADTAAEVRTLLGRATKGDSSSPTVGEDEALDPICGMTVHIHDTPYVLRVGGVAHYFCSRSCLNRYMSDSKPDLRV